MSKCNTDYKKISMQFEGLLDAISHQYYVQVDACNDFVLPINWDFDNRVNPNFHLAYVRKGQGNYRYNNGQKDQMTKGKLYFFTSGYCHSRTLDKYELPHMILLRFNLINRETRRPMKLHDTFGFSIQTDYHVYSNLMSKMVANYHMTKKKYGTAIATSIVEQILYELMNEITYKLTPKRADARVKKTVTYIHDHVENHITLDELCQVAGLSRNYYRKLFKAEYGIYPKAYMIQARLIQAENLLMETRYSIKEIAQFLGYSDPYSFSKQFKEKKGFSPSMFRRYITPTQRGI